MSDIQYAVCHLQCGSGSDSSMSPCHSNIPNLRIQTMVENEIFEMLSGGPAQTHVGTGGGGSSSDMPWGEKKKYNNTSRRRR